MTDVKAQSGCNFRNGADRRRLNIKGELRAVTVCSERKQPPDVGIGWNDKSNLFASEDS
jgi:hypothetical protein